MKTSKIYLSCFHFIKAIRTPSAVFGTGTSNPPYFKTRLVYYWLMK